MQFTVFQNSGIAHTLSAKLHMIQIAEFLFVEILIILGGFFHLMLFLNGCSGGERVLEHWFSLVKSIWLFCSD